MLPSKCDKNYNINNFERKNKNNKKNKWLDLHFFSQALQHLKSKTMWNSSLTLKPCPCNNFVF